MRLLRSFRLVRVPGAMPHFFAGLRVSITYARAGPVDYGARRPVTAHRSVPLIGRNAVVAKFSRSLA